MQGGAAAVRRKLLRIHRHDGGAVSDNKRRNNTFHVEHLRLLCNCVTYNRNQRAKLCMDFTINNLPRLLVYCTFFTDSGRNQRAAHFHWHFSRPCSCGNRQEKRCRSRCYGAVKSPVWRRDGATRGTHAPRRMHVAGIKAHTVPSSDIIIVIAVIVIVVIVTASAIITISIGFMVRRGTLCIVLLIFFLFFVVKQVVKRHQVR